jgi:tetratricopeptide (TPR) repeat protein
VRPRYPAQVLVSYFQAGRICDFIARTWSYDKLLAMMHQFAGGATTPEVIEKQLDLKPEEFDKRFVAAVEAELKPVLDHYDRWRAGMKELAAAASEKNDEALLTKAREIRDLFPDFVEGGNVYETLAEFYLAKGNKPAATAELEQYARRGGRNPAALKKLAGLLAETGRKKEAAQALARINYVYPLDEEAHRTLGGLLLDEGDAPGAVREFRAVVAAKPLDAASAHFNLARAYRVAKRNDDAKEQLILSLEAAPGYRPAQKMLLELSQ